MIRLQEVLYVLAFLTSVACTLLLLRGWKRTRFRMLLWSATCFVFLSVNNLLLIVDLLVFPRIDLRIWRLGFALIGVACILYAFIWDAE